MQNLSDISVIKSVLAAHGFTFSKALGQNFIINPTVCPRMADECLTDENTGVLEIGAGIGVLSAELCTRSKKVVCVELDDRLLPILADTLAEYPNFEVVNEDILKVDLEKLIAEKFPNMRVVVCANLPYYITSPVIMKLLESKLPIDAVTVMVQKEAAQRICAKVGSRDAGAVTVGVNFYAETHRLFEVTRGNFMPSPNVDSTVMRLDIRKTPAINVSDEKLFFRVVKAVFGQRRKTASNSISSGLAMPKDKVIAAIEDAGFPANVRAESMTMEELARLSESIKKYIEA